MPSPAPLGDPEGYRSRDVPHDYRQGGPHARREAPLGLFPARVASFHPCAQEALTAAPSGPQVGGPVYVEDAPGHEVRPLGGQEQHGAGDLVGASNTPQRALPPNGVALGAGEDELRHLGLDEAGGDGVDEDTVGARAFAMDWLMAFSPALLAP